MYLDLITNILNQTPIMSTYTPEQLFYGYTNNKKELLRELITYQIPKE